jgi:hypothetical protein
MAAEIIVSSKRGQLKNCNHYDTVIRQYDRIIQNLTLVT